MLVMGDVDRGFGCSAPGPTERDAGRRRLLMWGRRRNERVT